MEAKPDDPSTSGGHTVIALSTDLMDRSKLSGAWSDVQLVRSITALRAAVDEAASDGPAPLVIVDLHRVDDPAELAGLVEGLAPQGRLVAYGSHVDDEALAAATAAGAEAHPRSVFFRRLGAGEI